MLQLLFSKQYNMFRTTRTASYRKKIRKLKIDRQNINDMLGRPTQPEHRFKRGVFNFVGQIAKILFGTLDSSDADYYNNQIDRAYNNSKELTNLYKKQINVIQSSINTFSDLFKAHAKQFEEVNYNLEKLNKYILDNHRELSVTQINTETNSYLVECAEMLLEYEFELGTLTDAILLAHRGLIHPKLLTPKELFKILKESQYIPADRKLPVVLELHQFGNLIDVSDISIFYKDNRLVYIIDIPLIEQHDFILYHMIPFPIKQSEKEVFAFINPTYSYIGIRTDKQVYTQLSENDVSKCKNINNIIICKQTDLLYQISSTYTCESILLRTARLENILQECDVRITKFRTTVWHQLKTSNSWLYTAPREETLHVLCPDGKQRQTQLNATGLVTLAPECDGIADNALLNSKTSNIIYTIDKDFVPNVNLSTQKLCEDIKKHNVNISDLPMITISKAPHLDLNLLKIASSSLQDLYKEAEELGKHHRTRTFQEKTMSWLYYILYIIIVLVCLYLIAKCSLISKCLNIFRLCCIPKEGCTQYFQNCFNTNIRSQNAHPPFPVIPTSEASVVQNISLDEFVSRSPSRRSRSRNNRLSNL